MIGEEVVLVKDWISKIKNEWSVTDKASTSSGDEYD